MSKAVLISIRPKWCELIANGKKTVEVRKSRPKLHTPFKCYIYCTKDRHLTFCRGKRYCYADDHTHNAFDITCNGTIIGEFVCDSIDTYDDDTIFRFATRITRGGKTSILTARVSTQRISRITLTASGCTAGTSPTLKSTISRESYESSGKATATVFMLILGLQKETALIVKIQDAF